MDTVYRVLPYLLFRLGFVHHGLYLPSLILALKVLIPLLTEPVPFSQDTIRTPVTCSQSNSSSVSQNSELVSSFKEVFI